MECVKPIFNYVMTKIIKNGSQQEHLILGKNKTKQKRNKILNENTHPALFRSYRIPICRLFQNPLWWRTTFYASANALPDW